MTRLAAALGIAVLVTAAPAAAQTESRPGPWVLDVRGVTSPLPEDLSFYPRLGATALTPSRGFGLDVGGHVYVADIGASRLGLGGRFVRVRGVTKPPPPAPATPGTPGAPTQPAVTQQVQMDLQSVGPEVSFNFGTREGWSYISAGAGFTGITTRTAQVDPGRRETGRLTSLNAGGGARWFIKRRLAFGFDARLFRIGSGTGGTVEQATPPAGSPVVNTPVVPTPGAMVLSVSVGVSFR